MKKCQPVPRMWNALPLANPQSVWFRNRKLGPDRRRPNCNKLGLNLFAVKLLIEPFRFIFGIPSLPGGGLNPLGFGASIPCYRIPSVPDDSRCPYYIVPN
jgi:hypothetical protein